MCSYTIKLKIGVAFFFFHFNQSPQQDDYSSRGVYSVGSASDYGAQMLSHDLSDSHENWYSILMGSEYMQLGNADMCTHHVLRDPPATLSRGGYGEMAVERVGGEEEEKKKRRGGRGVGALLYPKHMRTFLKWTVPLHLP
ncbi:hypothetical protein N7501_006619 [Penicillium viridicatum]|nr:hypothetical protein N7501_006619 [Penicillium viridicatum]